MADICKWLHEQLQRLPLIKFPFHLEQLPENGIYFFYENDEVWGHGGNKLRIVRVGSHKEGNFKNRINEHYLLGESKMNFDKNKQKPSDRSIFRKNIGRALLFKSKDDYIQIWDIDFTNRENRLSYKHKRNIEKEKRLESTITRIIRDEFYFRFITTDKRIKRLGSEGLESSLIGTVAQCRICMPTKNWIGLNSPKKQIKDSGLWLVQHLKANEISDINKKMILNSVIKTKDWISEDF